MSDSVEVYYNFNRGLLSVRQRGRVVEYVDSISLADVEFIVRPGGRDRVRREGRKNVHAWIRGYRTILSDPDSTLSSSAVTYNPYRHDTFVYRANGRPIHRASFCTIVGPRVYVPRRNRGVR